MRYQCIDCKSGFTEKRNVCPECRSRYIVLVEPEQQKHDDQPHERAEEGQGADEREQVEDKQLEVRAKLKEGDIIKVNETLALVQMDAGDYYKVL